MKLTRKFYIPENAKLTVNIEALGIEVYEYSSGNMPAAMAFHGRAQKPDWHYRFSNEAHRAAKIKGFVEGYTAHAENVTTRKNERSAPTALKVGDILHGSWGYDQTNCDFFQVTGKKGERGIYVRPIAQRTVPGSEGFMCSHVMPIKDSFIGPETYHIAGKDSIAYDPIDDMNQRAHDQNAGCKKERHYSASLWDGTSCYSSHYA